MPDLDQRAAIAFLADPASYGPGRQTVERIDTHCSIVFLAGDRAYKLKRAIRYAALDYTTRARRHAACAAELRLNRRTAPALYLGSLAIARAADGRVRFDGAGEPLDQVVVMRRLHRADLFDRMLLDGRLDASQFRAVGAAIARLHAGAEIAAQSGAAAAIGRVIAENARELALVAGELDGADVQRLTARGRAALAALAPLLDRRHAAGRVRRGHGDLRLANICLFDGAPTLFDAIEFSEEIGCVDILYDFAFLLMDLCLHGRCDFANIVFNAYLDATREDEGLRCLGLFLALRAATRGYGLAGKARRTADPAARARLRALARLHVGAGLRFLEPAAATLIVLQAGADRAEPMATILAAHALPAPGARILQGHGDVSVWRRAESILAAGMSVLLRCEPGDATAMARARRLASRRRVPLLCRAV